MTVEEGDFLRVFQSFFLFAFDCHQKCGNMLLLFPFYKVVGVVSLCLVCSLFCVRLR